MQPKMSVDALQAFLCTEFSQVAEDCLVEAVGPMTCRVRMHPSEKHLRPGGTVSGPSLFSLADCGVYLAILAMIGPEALTVTTNASIDFMRKPAAGMDLLADVTLLKVGRVLAVGDVLIRSDGSDDVVARATLTYSIPQKG
jgi:uncharacterized protein (TIGR00369 family)